LGKQLDELLVNKTKTQYSIINLLTMKKTNQKIKVLFNLAIKNHQQNDYESAATNYEKILKIEPNHFGTNFSFGSLLIEAKKFEKAILGVIELKEKTSFVANKLNKDIQKIKNVFRNLGYYFIFL